MRPSTTSPISFRQKPDGAPQAAACPRPCMSQQRPLRSIHRRCGTIAVPPISGDPGLSRRGRAHAEDGPRQADRPPVCQLLESAFLLASGKRSSSRLRCDRCRPASRTARCTFPDFLKPNATPKCGCRPIIVAAALKSRHWRKTDQVIDVEAAAAQSERPHASSVCASS